VPDYFAAPITLEFKTSGAAIRKTVRTDGTSTTFSFAVPQNVEQVLLDPDQSLLALIERPQ
jgi:hypothetical protein